MDNRIIESELKLSDIMKGKKKVVLLHDEKRYSLSITRRGKLILTAAEEAISTKLSITRTAHN